MARSPRRYAPVSEPLPSSSSFAGVALEDHVSAVLAGAGPEVDDVVGGADRLFVVLDDDDGVAEIAQPGQRRQQRAIVALVQADRRLVEDVEHAGQVRPDLGREPDALPFAARQRRGAAAERQVADADVVEEVQAVANLAQDAAGDERSRDRSARGRRMTSTASEIGRSTYSEIVRPLTRTARLCGFSRSPWQPGHGRSARYGSRFSCSTQVPAS